MPNPKPNMSGLKKFHLPPGHKTIALRIRGKAEALDAFAALTAEERGKVIQAWFERKG